MPPLKTLYIHESNFDPEFTYFLPCRVLSMSHYIIGSGCGLAMQYYDTYDIIFLLSGSLDIYARNNKTKVLSGQVLIMPTNMEKDRLSAPENCEIIIIRCGGPLCASYENLINEGITKPVILSETKNIQNIFERILYYICYPTNINNALTVKALTDLFTELYLSSRGHSLYNGEHGHHKWFEAVMKFISDNYSSKITIKDLADKAGMSESHFFRIFIEYTGETPYRYLMYLRISNAKNMLLSTDRQVKDIAYSVGFNSVSRFIQVFKELTERHRQNMRKVYCRKQ